MKISIKSKMSAIRLRPALLYLLCAALLFAASPITAQDRQQQVSRFERDLLRQARTDSIFRAVSNGVMDMKKILYKSRAGDMDIPAFIFQPLELRGQRGHPAIVWVHENIRGHLYEYYIPFIKEAVAKGYVVIAPEYRGSWGYGQEHYDAIDYGGNEVVDVLSATDFINNNMSHVDIDRLGIIGWSHGGMIALLAIFKEPYTFKAASAIVPVTNLFQRVAYKGPSYVQRIDPGNRIGGLPHEKREIYKERSPVYHVDKLQIPLVVHVTKNDRDVNIEESMQLIDALNARKPNLSFTKVYNNPVGGHYFNRRVDRTTWERTDTKEQRDSWNRIWTLFDWYLEPDKGKK